MPTVIRIGSCKTVRAKVCKPVQMIEKATKTRVSTMQQLKKDIAGQNVAEPRLLEGWWQRTGHDAGQDDCRRP